MVSREGQSACRAKQKIDLLDITVLLLLFSGPFLNCYLFLTNKVNLAGQLGVIYIIVAILALIISLFSGNRFIPFRTLGVTVGLLMILASFFITKSLYSFQVARFDSELKLYIATIPSVILLSLCIYWKEKKDINLYYVFTLNAVLAIICGMVVVNSNGVTTAGLIFDTSGLLYQNTSYYAAYSFGMTVFLIQEKKIDDSFKVPAWILYVLIPLEIAVCFMAGGHGGFALLLALAVWAILVGKKDASEKRKMILTIIIAVIAFFYIVPNVIGLMGIDATGLERTIRLITEGVNDQGRLSLWRNSMAEFSEKPILGNGIGSVFYLFNSYSHNMFVDILCETGVLGLLAVLCILFLYAKRTKTLYSSGSMYRFLFMVFLCGFVMNLFSGYVWVNQQILLPISATLILPKRFCVGEKVNE